MSQDSGVTSFFFIYLHIKMSISCEPQLPIALGCWLHLSRSVQYQLLESLTFSDLISLLLNVVLWQHVYPRIPYAARPGIAELINKANG